MMRLYTSSAEEVIKAIHFCVSDFCLIALFLYVAFLYRNILFSKEQMILAFKLGLAGLSIYISWYVSPLPIHAYHALIGFFWCSVLCSFFALQLCCLQLGTRKMLQGFCAFFAACSTFQGGVACLQYFSRGFFGFRLLGEPKGTISSFSNWVFRIYEGCTSWALSLGSFAPSQGMFRSYGTFDHPNVLSGFLVCGVIFSLAIYDRSKNKRLVLAAIFVQIFALFATFSRAGLLTMGCMGVLWFSLQKRDYRQIATLVGTGAFCFIGFLPDLLYRGGVVNRSKVACFSNWERIQAQNASIRMILRRPLFGVGLENFSAMSRFEEDNSIRVHNCYLLLLAELGIIGVAVFCWFWLPLLCRGFFLTEDPLYCGVFCAVIALFTLGLFDFYPIVSHKIRLMFFLLPAFFSIPSRSESMVQPDLIEENVT